MTTLPKSLHTVRILVAVALKCRALGTLRGTDVGAILNAADAIGYPDASADDPLIVAAAAKLAKLALRRAA